MQTSIKKPIFYITHLYPSEMSIYGDIGNIIAMQRMLDKIGWQWNYQTVEIGQELPEHTDWYFMGGGQDADQILVAKDLLKKEKLIKSQIENGTAFLAICGGYQLLGREFVAGDGTQMQGINILPVKTKSLDSSITSRCIGNIIVQSDWLECELVGFENHGGQTFFTGTQIKPLGKVLKGFGNNFEDKVEGCVYKNVVGTYMHGSCLPKNPELTLWFINQIADNKTKSGQFSSELFFKIKSNKIDNSIALTTKNSLIKRFIK
jgi:lipid II isoglutaminyl synthase (glutamine-hydrolysing)